MRITRCPLDMARAAAPATHFALAPVIHGTRAPTITGKGPGARGVFREELMPV